MLELPNVTLVCADSVDAQRAIAMLEKCTARCHFGAVQFYTHFDTDYPHAIKIPALKTLYAYSAFMLKRAHIRVQTTHVLTVQHDGWILNPEAWNPDWLQYDYMGPLWIHDHAIDSRSVGSGGFSLRSRALMEFVSNNMPPWDDHDGDIRWGHEDGEIALKRRDLLQASGYKFGPPGEAARFAQGGNCDPAYHVERPFGFHGFWDNINLETGAVAPFTRR
jgi:hypothetical protein